MSPKMPDVTILFARMTSSTQRNFDAIVNSAATVVFDERLDYAVDLNTLGVTRLVALARSLGDIPLLHVSTAYVCGRVEGLVAE